MPHSTTRRQALISLGAAAAASALPGFHAFAQAPVSSAASNAGNSAVIPPGGSNPLCLADYEVLARQRMSHAAWEYIDSGSADEVTMRWNREALTRLRLQPRVMIDVSHIDTSISLLGRKHPHPVMIAPTAAHMLAHPAGEVATARGATEAGAIMIASTVSNRSVEEIAAVPGSQIWFQLYVEPDREATKALIQRAEAAGCRALCITVDLPVIYGRNRVARADEETPMLPFPNLNIASARASRPRTARRNKEFNWKELDWLRSISRTPILLKGILHPDDAEQAVRSGVAGIIVSNHGGRALDSVPATIDVLPRITERVAGRIPVLVDGGIRRGTDVLKALAFGATAVLIGRPSLYGLSVGGAAGVRHVIEILRTELEAAMALCGRTSIAAIDRSVIWPDSP